MKAELKMRAIGMRKEGRSLSEIVAVLGVSQGTVSVWVRSITLSLKAQERLREKIRTGQKSSQDTLRGRRLDKERGAVVQAGDIVSKIRLDHDATLLLCAMLYACEGTKSAYSGVSFMNSDPSLMKLFVDSLRASFPVDERKFRVQMHLHSYHDEGVQRELWSAATGVDPGQFIKTYRKADSVLCKKEGYQGCVNLRYHDVTVSRMLRAVAKECYGSGRSIFAGPPGLEPGTSRLE